MKKIKKSTGVAIAFLIYVSVTAAYLLPRNTEVGQTEKILTVVGSYVRFKDIIGNCLYFWCFIFFPENKIYIQF